jgi:UDP-N-acetylmuramyl tripeptide synthase
VYRNPFVITLGKIVRALARLKGGSGSAIPGVVVDKIAPGFAPKVLGALPYGVVVVSGTNGKTTTTKIVTELLKSMGLSVFTNSSGSNFMRGVIASLLSEIRLSGYLDADIAVLELDEAHAVHFVKRVAPRYSLLLNVMPDQLDRFGTVEYTANLLRQIAEHTTDVVVLNREDAQLAVFGDGGDGSGELTARVRRFGLNEQMRSRFLAAIGAGSAEGADRAGGAGEPEGAGSAEHPPSLSSPLYNKGQQLSATVILNELKAGQVEYEINGTTHSTSLILKGLHNAYNGAGALALVREILADGYKREGLAQRDGAQRDGLAQQESADYEELDRRLVSALSYVHNAFGRGESFVYNGREIEMLLVKNAGGFSLALESFDAEEALVMRVVNDEAGDGRDVSWLFDVDFTVLRDNDVVMLSGTRAYDMALRLSYDEVSYQQVMLDPIVAIDHILTNTENAQRPLHIFCTYTAMMIIRPRLIALTGVAANHVAATDSMPAGVAEAVDVAAAVNIAHSSAAANEPRNADAASTKQVIS